MGSALQRLQRIQRRVEAFRKLAPEEASQQRSSDLASLPLLEFIPTASPWLVSPDWFSVYADRLDSAPGAGHRTCLAAPPQHGKTVIAEHWIARSLLGSKLRNGYVTYSATRAEEVAYNVRQIGRQCGVEFSGKLEMLRGPLGGSCKFIGIGGPLTGAPIDGLVILDDLIKNRRDADSATIREHVYREVHGVVLRRLHMGASAIMMATRWHPDDPSGREIRAGWEYLNLRAIADEGDPCGRLPGEALAPVRFTREALDSMRAEMGEHEWWAQYQGEPRPRGAALFAADPPRFRDLPVAPYRVSYGVDLAYSSKTHADRSVCLRCVMIDGTLYVTAGRVSQVSATEFLLTLRAMRAEQPGRFRWYAGGTERGAADFIRQKLPELNPLPATGDKFTRAQPVAAAWNAGKVVLPDERSQFYGDWVDQLLDEVTSFTGVNDPHDDIVDALAAGFDELASGSAIDAPSLNLRGYRFGYGGKKDDWDEDD